MASPDSSKERKKNDRKCKRPKFLNRIPVGKKDDPIPSFEEYEKSVEILRKVAAAGSSPKKTSRRHYVF